MYFGGFLLFFIPWRVLFAISDGTRPAKAATCAKYVAGDHAVHSRQIIRRISSGTSMCLAPRVIACAKLSAWVRVRSQVSVHGKEGQYPEEPAPDEVIQPASVGGFYSGVVHICLLGVVHVWIIPSFARACLGMYLYVGK